MPLILEGLVTTQNADQSLHVAPMGPLVDSSLTHFTLRPFQTSQTFANLQRTREGVLHVTDDVELLAQAAINRLQGKPAVQPATVVRGYVLTGACRWFEFRIRVGDLSEARARLECDVVHQGQLRDFFGLNRAKHAVVEAAILATRRHLLPPDELAAELQRLRPLVDKTGGESEHRAFALLEAFVREPLAGPPECHDAPPS